MNCSADSADRNFARSGSVDFLRAVPSAAVTVLLRGAAFPVPNAAVHFVPVAAAPPIPADAVPGLSASGARRPSLFAAGSPRMPSVPFRIDSFRYPVPSRTFSPGRDWRRRLLRRRSLPPCARKRSGMSLNSDSRASMLAMLSVRVVALCASRLPSIDRPRSPSPRKPGPSVSKSLQTPRYCSKARASACGRPESLPAAPSFASTSDKKRASSAAAVFSVAPFLTSFQVAAMISFWRCEILPLSFPAPPPPPPPICCDC